MLAQVKHYLHLTILSCFYIGLALILAEVGFRWAGFSPQEHEPKAGKDKRIGADSYADRSAEFVQDYYREFVLAWPMRWEPYAYWRRRPFSGQYVNIDEQGIRKTWSDSQHTKSCTIYFFGGSAAWGTGVTDDETIPSYLAKALASKDIYCRIVNFGESGYVLMQNIQMLLQELHIGRQPTIAIFYDGVNDVYARFQNGQAGLTLNEENRRIEFNLKKELDNPTFRKRLFKNFIFDALRKSALLRFLADQGASILPHKNPDLKRGLPLDAKQDDKAGQLHSEDAPADIYRSMKESYAVIKALSSEYNFSSLAFIQPNIFFKEHRSEWEQQAYEGRRNVETIYLETYHLLDKAFTEKSMSIPGKSLGNIFKEEKEAVFLDAWHINRKGNQQVAAAMLPLVLQTLENISSTQ